MAVAKQKTGEETQWPPGEVPGPTPDPADASSAAGDKAANNGIPFVFTQDMKRKLRLCGYTDGQIADIRPDESHRILNGQNGGADRPDGESGWSLKI
jgi:hypothetical protein